MYRSNSYNAEFSKEMRNLEFAKQYLSELINDEAEGLSVEMALCFVIKRMGTTDFANLVGESKQTVDKFLKGQRNPKLETLDKFLKAFGLVTIVRVKPIDEDDAA